MNARGSFLTRYALFLFKRELSILSYFLIKGRKRRMLMGAYWQASFLPGLLGLFFVVMRLAGMDLGPAIASVVLFSVGALVTEILLFEQNKFTWPVFQRIIEPGKFNRAVKDRLGFEGFPGRDAWVTVEASAPEQVRRMILSSLQQTRQTPPTLQLYLMQAPEVKVAGIMGAFTLIMMFGPSGSTAFTVPVLSFLLGVVLRRVKQGVDSALVWPFVENLIDWTMVNSLAGGRYERAEFN
ncbi:MAG: hypothetical protein CBC49_000770 [Alphaproteobacteria bacterium TMED89]|nr:hypothetical protein [Rhodospirillaceae bacterium]RPH19953.1 MAG: hypothetical protein CBC49_000770 [Alphaproteobacteria bacterium TMED89]